MHTKQKNKADMKYIARKHIQFWMIPQYAI